MVDILSRKWLPCSCVVMVDYAVAGLFQLFLTGVIDGEGAVTCESRADGCFDAISFVGVVAKMFISKFDVVSDELGKEDTTGLDNLRRSIAAIEELSHELVVFCASSRVSCRDRGNNPCPGCELAPAQKVYGVYSWERRGDCVPCEPPFVVFGEQ